MKKVYRGVVARVEEGSIAEELGILVGDKLVEINGLPMQDIIDVSFASASEEMELVIEKADGMIDTWEIEKDEDEQLGIEFTEAVFDGVRLCANNCIFCFVEQMPRQCRQSLYVKDDDYRLSFLYGNFITLTNMTNADLQRIERYRLSPLYVSVHATDGDVRAKMLGLERARQIKCDLDKLQDVGVQIHAQVVLCPGWNDGDVLYRTISDLYERKEQVISLAIVPVGLTSFRNELPLLQSCRKEDALEVIEMVEKLQKKFRAESGKSFVYLADEFYTIAEKRFLPSEYYDDFPQIENGIGMVSDFITLWEETEKISFHKEDKQYTYKKIKIITGEAFAPVLRVLINELQNEQVQIEIVAVKNMFFAGKVDVAGLLTGQDIIAAVRPADNLKQQEKMQDSVCFILPSIVLRKGEGLFLDGMSAETFQKRLGAKVIFVENARVLKEILMNK